MTMTRGGFFKTVAAALGALKAKPATALGTNRIEYANKAASPGPFANIIVSKWHPKDSITFFNPKMFDRIGPISERPYQLPFVVRNIQTPEGF